MPYATEDTLMDITIGMLMRARSQNDFAAASASRQAITLSLRYYAAPIASHAAQRLSFDSADLRERCQFSACFIKAEMKLYDGAR